MANVTKIYELKTLGYDKLIAELERVEQGFRNLTISKQALNVAILKAGDDEKKLIPLNKALKDHNLALAQTRLERLELDKVILATLNTHRQELLARKLSIDANKAEAGSYNDLATKLKELQALRKNANPGNNINFQGQSLNFAQAQAQAKALTAQVNQLGSQLQVTTAVGANTTGVLSNGFNNMKNQLGQMIIMYTGWFAAFQEVGKIIQSNIKLSDSFADLQIRIKGSADDVQTLFEQLKKIDTRTSLTGLVDIANIISKKGVPATEIAALTKEFDNLNVVLGGEIGEPSTATANIIKLISIFNDDKRVTAERVREIGTELFKLTTTGVATGEFLVNFAERVGAVRGVTGLTLPSIFGMGAALQQLGQRVEVSSTAIIQFTTRLFADVPKFAKAAGVSVEEFRKILANDPLEGLIQVAQGLAQLTDEDFHANFEEIAQDFQSVGVQGVRVKAVLGDIATNGAFVRDRIKEASTSTADFARQSEAVALKQNTFAATLARVRKEFETIGTSKAVQNTLAAVASLILFLVSNIGVLITILGVYATAWTIANSAMIATRISTIAANVAFTVQYSLLVISTTAARAYAVSMGILSRVLAFAAGASSAFGAAMRVALVSLGGVGILIAIAKLLELTGVFSKASRAVSDFATRQQALNEIYRSSSQSIAEQISKIDSWILVIKDAATSADVKALAVQKLIDIDSIFSSVIDGQVIKLDALDKAYKAVTDSIILNAQAQAAGTLAAEKQQRVLEVSATRQRLEIEFAQQSGITKTVKGLTSTESSILDDLAFEGGDIGLRVNGKSLAIPTRYIPELISRLKAKEQEATRTYTIYLTEKARLDAEFASKQKQQDDKKDKELIDKSVNEALTIPELEALIKGIDKELSLLREGDPKLKELHNKRLDFERRLKALKGEKDKPGRPYFGARVGGQEKDVLAEIEAEMRNALAAEEAKFVALQIVSNNGVKEIKRASYDEETDYLRNIKDINLKFLDQKIKYLESQQSLNAKEKEVLAGFKKDKLDIELAYLKSRQAVDDKEFDDRRNALKNQLQEQLEEAQANARLIENDPLTSDTQRAQAKLEADQKILALQVAFNSAIDLLEKQFNQRTTTNAKEGAKAVYAIKEKLTQDEFALEEAKRTDADKLLARDIAKINSDYERLKAAILNNDKLTVAARALALEQLDKLYNFTILSRELARLTEEFQRVKKLYDTGLATEKAYLEAKAAMQKKANEVTGAGNKLSTNNTPLPSGANTIQAFQDQMAQLFNIDENDPEYALLGEVMAQTFSLATDAMNAYFDAEEQRIRDSLEIHLQRLDVEKEQVKARAQSQAEIDSIEKQYTAKRLKAQKEAGEELKKMRRAEAKIALAAELANIAVAAAGNPANPFTFGVAGAIMYAVLAGLAFGRYAINIGNINREKFSHGGWVKRGGQIRGASHAHGGVPFNYEAEGGELAIVRTRNANPMSRYTISGNQMEIASMLNKLGGGTNFKPGARMFATGGFLGSNYQAPVFRTSSSNGDDTLETLATEMRLLAIAQSNRIDRLEVYQVTDSVAGALKKKVKQEDIGTL